jgi:hypothetical protein
MMTPRKMLQYFLFLSCLILVRPHILYQANTDLDYRQHDAALSFPVDSLSVCANQCAEKAQCVSFFFNPRDFRCQTEGRIYLSFDGSDAGPWRYYGLYHIFLLTLRNCISIVEIQRTFNHICPILS